jgi:hypothetical protein
MNIRHYKKLYYICKDDNGKKIYAGDVVEVRIPWETKTSYQSVVYFNMLDGAFIDAHPGHVKMGLSTHRSLRDFLDKEAIDIMVDDELTTVKPYCKKVKSFYKL